MADHDEEALLQEELDLDYEVDDELPEEELLGDNDDFDLEDNEAYNEEHGTGDDGENEAHTTQEQEEDILDLGVTDTGIDDLDEEGFQNSQGGDDSINQKKERDRFHSERTNASGHTPIVFDGSSEQDGMTASTPKNQKYAQKYQRIINNANFRGRGGRGNFRSINRGNFHNVNNNHNRSGFVHSRLGYRQQQGTVDIQNINKHPPLESNKVLINPHFRGNVQPSRDARLVWDAQAQQNQHNYQQPFQNLGNFSQPIMQHHPQPNPPPQQIQLTPNVMHQTNWNNPPPHQNYPVEGHYNQQPNVQVGMPIPIVTVQNVPQHHQQEIFRNNIQPQIQFEQPKLGPMFVNNAPVVQQPQPQPPIAPQQNCGFRGRGGGVANRGGLRIMNQPLQHNTLLRTIPTEPDYNRPIRNPYPRKFQQNSEVFIDDNQPMNMPQQNAYNQPHLVPTYNQSQFQSQSQQQFNPQPQQPIYAPNEHQQQFIPNNYNHPPENIQSYPPQANVQIHQNQQSYPPQGNVQIQLQNQQYIPPLNQQVVQRSPVQHTHPQSHNVEQYPRRVMHKRHSNENQPAIRRPFHNQNPRSPQKRNNPIHSNEVSPKKKKSLDFRNLQEVPRVDVPDTTVFFEDKNPAPQVIEEEDEETRAYRLKIEEQRKLREQVIKQKEERRKKAAAQATSGSEVSTTTGNIPIPTVTKVVQNQPQRKIIKPLMERKILPPVLPQNKNRLIVLTNQQKQSNIVRPALNKVINRNLVKIENKQIMPNTVSSTQPIKKPLIITKRVVRAIPRQSASVTSATSTTQTLNSETSESGDDIIDKEHLSQFLSTRTVVPKAPPTAVNGTITSNASALLKTNIVKISNLSASTTELKIRKLCKGVGLIQNIQMSPNVGQAIIRFKNIAHAHNFYKKYQRKMVDLSLIDVALIPAT